MPIRVPWPERCAFCDYLSGVRECAFVRRTDHVSSFVNIRQYERGALLVIPNNHVETALDLDVQLLATVRCEAVLVGRALIHAFGATGLNIFQNNGMDAGQSEPHYHVHVVPRYPGSDSRRIFHSTDFEPVPLGDQFEVAAAVCRALSATSQRVGANGPPCSTASLGGDSVVKYRDVARAFANPGGLI